MRSCAAHGTARKYTGSLKALVCGARVADQLRRLNLSYPDDAVEDTSGLSALTLQEVEPRARREAEGDGAGA